jgi:flagellar protein FliJ
MADFKFRLATLLRIREAARDERRMDLADSRRTEESLQQQLERLHAERERVTEAARELVGPGAVAVNRWADAHRYQQMLESRRCQLSAQLAELAAEIDRRREVLLEADRDVRTLERIRETQRLRHHQETHRQENRRLDEAVQLRVAVRGTS